MTKVKVAGYGRMSTNDQLESPKVQEEKIKPFIPVQASYKTSSLSFSKLTIGGRFSLVTRTLTECSTVVVPTLSTRVTSYEPSFVAEKVVKRRLLSNTVAFGLLQLYVTSPSASLKSMDAKIFLG